MKPGIILSCFLLALPASAWAQSAPSRLFSEPHPTISSAVAADYAAAMTASEQVAPGEGAPLLALRTRWMWVAPEGATVQRIAENTFRWRSDNCLDAFCAAVDCFVTTWPTLVCSDGAERKIAAPDLATVVLDGVTFKRSVP